MALTIFALLAVAGFYYLKHYFKAQPGSITPATGPKAGGFGAGDIWGAGFLVVLLVGNTIESFGKKQTFTTNIIVASCVLYLLLVVALVTLLIARGRNPIRIFGLNWREWPREVPQAFLSLLCIYPAIIVLQLVMEKIYGPDLAPQEILRFLANNPGLHEKLLLILLAIVMAPLAEEFIFRGYIFGVARQYIGRWPAILLNSLVFAFIHGHIPAFLGLFVLAVFLTLVYERTGSLWAPIMLHAFFNTVTIIGTLYFPAPLP